MTIVESLITFIMDLHNFKTLNTLTAILYSPGFVRPRITRRRP